MFRLSGRAHVRGAERRPTLLRVIQRVEGRALEAREHPMIAFGVIASAVLHFARDEAHFSRMVEELGRVLAPGGFLLARLASTIGLEATLGNVAGTRATLPDGSVRFVVDEAMLIDWTERLGGRLLDPIKTTNVQGQRCMTTWCVEKKPSGA